MEEIVKKILEQNINLFGNNPTFKKINIGFTNAIYEINNTFIVKICINENNQDNFIKEINFYKENKKNNLIPKLYYSSTSKKEIPFHYEILEKIEGVSLYSVWHTLEESQREDIIKQLCTVMKEIHKNIGEYYDWANKLKEEFKKLYEKAKKLNIFSSKEKGLLNEAFRKFDVYLDSNDIVLIHNDLHFDNIFYNNGKIKLIDFERSIYAPRDFELDILYRMIRMPWKYASEETEKYTKLDDYQNIMLYIKKYYPKLVDNPYLYQRLAIYDIIYFLNQLVKHPELGELKDNVISSANTVIKNII